jgi:hypothetical protein
MNRRDFLKLGMVSLASLVYGQDGENKKVILCFDGSKSNSKWREVIDLGKRISDITGNSAHFSDYANSGYLFTKLDGGSDIGWGGSNEEIELRKKLVQEAIDEGHDIGSHTVRHKDGSNWSKSQWFEELREFDEHFANFFHDVNGNPYKPVGFRAPYLGYNDALYQALRELDYVYDVSIPGDFVREKNGITVVGLPMYQRDSGSSVLGMDYNWHVSNVSDKELERMLNREEAKKNPVIISLHFSDWKHGEKSYYDVCVDFMLRGAKEGRFSFCSMKEFVDLIKV